MDLDYASKTSDLIDGTSFITYAGKLALSGSFAADDNFKLFNAKSYNGVFSAITPDSPGPDLKWDASQLTVNGTLKVVSISGILPPTIGGVRMAGSNLIISGSGGAPNGTCDVLASTSVILPLAQWTPVATGQFAADGSFISSSGQHFETFDVSEDCEQSPFQTATHSRLPISSVLTQRVWVGKPHFSCQDLQVRAG